MHIFNPVSPSPSALCCTCGKRQSSPMHEESVVRSAKSEAEQCEMSPTDLHMWRVIKIEGKEYRTCLACGYIEVFDPEFEAKLAAEHRLTEALIEAVGKLVDEIERPSHVCPTCPTGSNDAHFEYCLFGRMVTAYRNLKSSRVESDRRKKPAEEGHPEAQD